MKTFNEAFFAVVSIGAVQSEAEERRVQSEAAERGARFLSIAEEIHSHGPLLCIVQGILDTDASMQEAMLGAVELGVRIGMEMERSENGGIDLAGMATRAAGR